MFKGSNFRSLASVFIFTKALVGFRFQHPSSLKRWGEMRSEVSALALALASLSILLGVSMINSRSHESTLLAVRVRARTQGLDGEGVSWAQGYGINQGFAGEPNFYPYVERSGTSDVLETEDKDKLSTEARYPFVKYYGQAVDFIHGNELDPTFYNYEELGSNEDFMADDNTLDSYSDMIGLRPAE